MDAAEGNYVSIYVGKTTYLFRDAIGSLEDIQIISGVPCQRTPLIKHYAIKGVVLCSIPGSLHLNFVGCCFIMPALNMSAIIRIC